MKVWKVALGVVLGLFVFTGACVAVIGGAANEVVEDSEKPATVRVEAAPDVCWLVTLTSSGGEAGGLGQNQQEGCGTGSFELSGGLGRNAIVNKRSGAGPLTAILVVDGEEKARQTTNAEFGSVTVSP